LQIAQLDGRGSQRCRQYPGHRFPCAIATTSKVSSSTTKENAYHRVASFARIRARTADHSGAGSARAAATCSRRINSACHASSHPLSGGPSTLAISSDASVAAYPRWGAYSVSKAGLDHLARLWAVELADHGVSAFSVFRSFKKYRGYSPLEFAAQVRARWGSR